VISVRGTTFDVRIEDDDATTLVSVEEGQVGVRNVEAGGEVLLGAGDSVTVYANQPLAMRQVDRGQVAQGALRTAAQTMYQVLLRRQMGTTPGGTLPGSGNGDHKGNGTGSTGNPPPTPSPTGAPPPPAPAPPTQN
jgi:hypothetical protein